MFGTIVYSVLSLIFLLILDVFTLQDCGFIGVDDGKNKAESRQLRTEKYDIRTTTTGILYPLLRSDGEHPNDASTQIHAHPFPLEAR